MVREFFTKTAQLMKRRRIMQSFCNYAMTTATVIFFLIPLYVVSLFDASRKKDKTVQALTVKNLTVRLYKKLLIF